MKRIGVGVIGWGFMGRTHTHSLRAIPLFYQGLDFEPVLAGVCSRRLDQAEEARRQLGFGFATDDYRALLAREDIDAVSICTPNALHEEMAIAAMRAGKHVYLDKPVAVTAESAERMLRVQRETGVKCQVVLNNRFFPSTLRARQLVQEGRLGEILSFTCRYLHSGSVDPCRAMGWKQGLQGGVLLDMGSHALDLLTWLIGLPQDVLCAERTLYPERPTAGGGVCRELAEDHALMMLRMKNGALGTVEASKIATGTSDEMTLEICGAKGALRWNLMEPSYLEYYDQQAADAPYGGTRGYTRIECVGKYPAPGGSFLPAKNTVGWDRGHIHCYYSFLDCVAHDRQPSPSLEEGVILQRLMEEMQASARTGSWVRSKAGEIHA